MSGAMNLLLVVLALSMGLCFVRLLRGPSLPDRVVALDQIGVHVAAMAILYSIAQGRVVFLDMAVVASLLSFLATVAFARYLEQGAEL